MRPTIRSDGSALSRRISHASAAVGAAPMRPRGVEWLRDPQRFLALEREWDELAQLQRSPFLRHAWFRSWWHAFGQDLELASVALWQEERIAALFPLAVKGMSLIGLAGGTAPDFRPFGRSPQPTAAVVEEALRVRPRMVRLYGVPREGAAFSVLRAGAQRNGFAFEAVPMQNSPYVEMRGSFEEYLAGLHRDVRRVATRRRQVLAAEHDIAWTVLDAPPDLEAQLEEVLVLEAAGWKGRNRGAVLSSAEHAAFYRELARAFGADGRFVLTRLQIDGQLAAAAICLLDFDRVWLLKTAYDEAVSRYSPGMLIAFAIIERCHELGLEAFELLGQMTEWKRRLRPETRDYDAVRLYRRRPVPLAALGYRRYVHPRLRAAYRVARMRRRR